MYDHCQAARTTASCPTNPCLAVWRHTLELCHRVRSLNPALAEFTATTPTRYCLSSVVNTQGYADKKLVQLFRT